MTSSTTPTRASCAKRPPGSRSGGGRKGAATRRDRRLDAWQQGIWRLTELPVLLGAQTRWFAGGTHILGVSGGGRRRPRIALNDLIADSPLEVVILTHECTHVLEAGRGLCLCAATPAAIKAERATWLHTARVAVSDEQVALLRSGRLAVSDVADSNSIPNAMVWLRLLPDPLGLAAWSTWLARAVRKL